MIQSRAQEVARRLRPTLERDLSQSGLQYGSAVFVRIFKQEKRLELWVEADGGKFVLFRDYPVCAYSGTLGPKLKQGDGQAPEGFYRVATSQLKPDSRYHLAFNLGYPNAHDRWHGRTGDFLMVHGNCVSIGCYAMGDPAIEEIYTLVSAALEAGQAAIDVHVFPFRLEADRLQEQAASPWLDFWMELKPAYDHFEKTRVPPVVGVRDGHYTTGGA